MERRPRSTISGIGGGQAVRMKQRSLEELVHDSVLVPFLQQQFSIREAKNDMAVAHKSVVKIVIITPLYFLKFHFPSAIMK